MKKLIFPVLLVLGLAACDDVVDIPLENTDPFLTVDAWLTNTPDTQRIVLTYTRPYFDNGRPTPVLGAVVQVSELQGNVPLTPIFFTDSDEDGVYEWIPPAGESFGEIGKSYVLDIAALGNTYNSFSTMGDVPPVDSITFEYNEKNPFFTEDWYYGEFWARDLVGEGNSYWIKSFVNDTLLSQPEDINLAFDGGFSSGSGLDSIPFIQPIRTGINPSSDNDDGPSPSPFKIGDKLKVELHAITNEAWFFLARVQDETFRNPGFGQLFANPLANSPTNIIANNDAQVVGFFSVASVSSLEVVMSEDNIVDRIPE